MNKKISSILFIAVVAASLLPFFICLPLMWLFLAPMVAAEFLFFRHDYRLFCLSFIWVLFFICMMSGMPWPFGLVVPLAAYLAVLFLSKKVKAATSWPVFGGLEGRTLPLMLSTIVSSSIALVLWARLSDPDLPDLAGSIPAGGIVLIVTAGLLFTVFNSVVEEFIFRGVLWDGLTAVFGSVIIVNIVQAVFFGIIHYAGFPRGFSGMSMAFVYGIFLGLIKYYSRGMFYPVVTHFFADITIYIILYMRFS